MFSVNSDLSIYLTRGDIAIVSVQADDSDGESYMFKAGDVVRFQVFEKSRHSNVVIRKDVEVNEDTLEVDIPLTSEDTRIGSLINRPVDYWYEVELNPDTAPQTFIGYDVNGPKIFRLYPEGGNKDGN